MAAREVLVVSGARTAIGDYGASLKDIPATKLGSIAIAEAVKRAGIDAATVGHVVLGSVVHGEARDMYISRVAAVEAGIPVGTPCLTVNRLCGSGLQAIVSASQHILLGDVDVAIGAGAESMSRAAYFLPAARWGQRMGDGQIIDAMVGALTDPFGTGHMGITAENLAAKHGFTREEQDAFSVESHRRAAAAIAAGHFKAQVVPVELKTKKGPVMFDTDEHVRKDAKPEDFAKLRPAFKKDGSVTAGNASGINDAGAAVDEHLDLVRGRSARCLGRAAVPEEADQSHADHRARDREHQRRGETLLGLARIRSVRARFARNRSRLRLALRFLRVGHGRAPVRAPSTRASALIRRASPSPS